MELLLVRHAEPIRVEGGHGTGPADPGLTARGRDQTGRLAAWLAHEPIDAVVTSPLVRARETAQPVAAAFGLEAEVVDGIAEWDAESDEYIPVEELRELKDERWHAMIEGRWVDTGGVDPSVFQAQIVPAFEELIGRFAGQRVVAVTHGGVVNVFTAHVLGIDRYLWFHPEYTSVTRVHASRAGIRSIGTVNETAHLVATRTDTPSEVAP
jgi:broad specificity phosphatase PhoE